ncbi:MAG: pitrilysin family protein [Candidatus Curtissbacteria bacterium]
MENKEFERLTLDNGLRVILAPMPGLKSASAIVLCGAGSRFETKKTIGLSHFLEHMFFKGTKKRPTAMDVASEIDAMGGANNAFTSKEYTGYYIKAASTHIEHILEILSDMLHNSLFKNEEFERERNVILQELHMRHDDPKIRVLDLMEEVVLGMDQPLGWDTGGYPKIIAKQTREQMISYIDERYYPNNMVLVVAGSFDREEVMDAIQKYYGHTKEKKVTTFLPYVDKQTKLQIEIDRRKTRQAAVAIAFKGLSRFDDDRYALDVLTTILGGGMSSRMFDEVREKRGLAYYVRTGSEYYHDAGVFVTYSGIDLPKVTEAIKVIVEQYARIRDEKVGEKELAKAKESIKGQMALSFEDSLNVAQFYGFGELLENKIDTFEDEIAHIDSVKAADIARVAKRLIRRDKMSLAVVGPFREKAAFEKLLKL